MNPMISLYKEFDDHLVDLLRGIIGREVFTEPD